jgi:hypothetical protein
MSGMELLLKLNFRLKHLQITSLISQDGFISSQNLSISTDDFVDRLSEFVDFWYISDRNLYPNDMHATWLSYFEVNLTRVLHPKGFCFTFNFPGTSEFFRLDRFEVSSCSTIFVGS